MSTATATKLEKLLIGEVSGVDDPANQIPGWMVAKATGAAPELRVGPDTAWIVGDAEKRVRALTGAEDGPTPKYAACFLYSGGEGDRFGDFKFLVTDVVDGELALMPAALKAAAQRLPGTDLSEADKDAVGALIEDLSKRVTPAAPEADASDATSILGKVRLLLSGNGDSPGKEDLNMDKAELTAILDERDEALVAKFAAAVAPAVEAPVEGTPAAAETTVPATELSEAQVAQVTKAIEDGLAAALAPYNEILENVINRTAAVEKNTVRRTSLEGQEGGDDVDADTAKGAEPTPTQKAIRAAFERGSVTFGDGKA